MQSIRTSTEKISKVPETFDDDYKNRAQAAAEAKIRVDADLTYFGLGLAQPDEGSEVGELISLTSTLRKSQILKT